MNYAYGRPSTTPRMNPYWAYGNFFSGYTYPTWNPARGYGLPPYWGYGAAGAFTPGLRVPVDQFGRPLRAAAFGRA